ncbi:hypothetical protein GCM10009678_29540 [Actinomadura kijaniata]
MPRYTGVVWVGSQVAGAGAAWAADVAGTTRDADSSADHARLRALMGPKSVTGPNVHQWQLVPITRPALIVSVD